MTFQQLITACFHPVEAEQERVDRAVFEGTDGGRVPGFESGEGIHLYRHDALSRESSSEIPLYMLHNPATNSCLLASTPVPFRDKHFLNDKAQAYTAEEAFQKVVEFFSTGKKLVLPTTVS